MPKMERHYRWHKIGPEFSGQIEKHLFEPSSDTISFNKNQLMQNLNFQTVLQVFQSPDDGHFEARHMWPMIFEDPVNNGDFYMLSYLDYKGETSQIPRDSQEVKEEDIPQVDFKFREDAWSGPEPFTYTPIEATPPPQFDPDEHYFVAAYPPPLQKDLHPLVKP